MSDHTVIGHWHLLAEDFKTSSQDFYSKVEAALTKREIPKIETSRIMRQEGGLESAKREYLRARRGALMVDICCAPFGKGSFFSWWVLKPRPSFLTLFCLCLALLLVVVFALLAGAAYVLGNNPGGFIIGIILDLGSLWFLGYLVSEGVIEIEDRVIATPIVGRLYVMVFNPDSLYRLDTALMFRESVANAVNEVIDEIFTEGGRPALTLEERRPGVRDLPG